jgi:hypothetical protein
MTQITADPVGASASSAVATYSAEQDSPEEF